MLCGSTTKDGKLDVLLILKVFFFFVFVVIEQRPHRGANVAAYAR